MREIEELVSIANKLQAETIKKYGTYDTIYILGQAFIASLMVVYLRGDAPPEWFLEGCDHLKRDTLIAMEKIDNESK